MIHHGAQTAIQVCTPDFYTGLPFPPLRASFKNLTPLSDDQLLRSNTGKNFAFTCFPLWTLMKSNVFTPNTPHYKRKWKPLWASCKWWPSSLSGWWAQVHVVSATELHREAWDTSPVARFMIFVWSGWRRSTPCTMQTAFCLKTGWEEQGAKSELSKVCANTLRWAKGRTKSDFTS